MDKTACQQFGLSSECVWLPPLLLVKHTTVATVRSPANSGQMQLTSSAQLLRLSKQEIMLHRVQAYRPGACNVSVATPCMCTTLCMYPCLCASGPTICTLSVFVYTGAAAIHVTAPVSVSVSDVRYTVCTCVLIATMHTTLCRNAQRACTPGEGW